MSHETTSELIAQTERSPAVLRLFYLIAGTVCLALGALGAVLPVLPTTPLLLLTAFCYARGSVRFHRWFTKTRLYHNYLESFLRDRAMTRANKIRILTLATAMLALSFFFCPFWPGRAAIVLVTVWMHIYFSRRIRTLPPASAQKQDSCPRPRAAGDEQAP